MNLSIGSIVRLGVIAAALTGCGGSNSSGNSKLPDQVDTPPPEVLEGTLTELGITGLAYSTPTQSGVIESSGGFQYLAGENVEFSLGEQLVVTLPGAEVIGFTQVFETLPTTQRGLTWTLEEYEKNPAFHKLVNLFYLLIFLDGDQNPANGIDVSGFADGNLLDNISLDQPIKEFQEQLQTLLAETYDIQTETMPVVELFEAIYESASIEMLVQLESRRSTDYGNDGTEDRYLARTFDDALNLTSEIEDRDNDGCLEEEYHKVDNEFGGITTTETFRDFSDEAGCYITRQYIYRYDEDANEMGYESRNDNNRDGELDQHRVGTSFYDNDGQLDYSLVKADGNVGGVVGVDGIFDAEYRYENEYNAQGLYIKGITKLDLGLDGSIDELNTSTLQYDEEGRVIFSDYTRDSDNNPATPNAYSQTSFEFNEHGNQTKYSYLSDGDGDGSTDSESSHTYTFNDENQQISRIYRHQNYSNSTARSYGYTYTYYDDGERATSEYFSDGDDDGTPERIRKSEYKYDSKGREIQELYYSDSNDDDQEYDSLEKYTYVYGADDNLTSERYDYDDDFNDEYEYYELYTYTYNQHDDELTESYIEGDITYEEGQPVDHPYYEETTTREYNAAGNLATRTEEEDDNYDGVFELTSVERYEYQDIPDGFSFVIADYLGFDTPLNYQFY